LIDKKYKMCYNMNANKENGGGCFRHLPEGGVCYGRDNIFYFISDDNYNLHKEITAYSAK